MLRIGHKGADAVVPGNTIASFRRAVEIGVDMIEFDVLRTRDGENGPLVVAHDWGAVRGAKPPRLDEVLEAFRAQPLDRVRLHCDLKLPGREDELVSALLHHDLLERASISTMYTASLLELHRLEPALSTGWSYPRVTRDWDRNRLARPALIGAMAAMRARLPRVVMRRAPELGVSSLWCFHKLISPALARACRTIGIELIAWTVDDRARIAQLRSIGVDGICSNDPRLLHP